MEVDNTEVRVDDIAATKPLTIRKTNMKEFHKYCATIATIGTFLLFSAVVQAETFSFSSNSKATSQIMIPAPGGGVMGSVWVSGSSKIKDSKRGEITNTFVCATNTNPPSELFHQQTFCDVAENDNDTFSIFGGCNFLNPERTESTCVGGLIGKTGAFAGRSGSITWHGKISDGATVMATGAGVWNE